MIIFEHNAINSDTTVIEFKALENEQEYGKCILVLHNSIAEVTFVNYDENNSFIVEGLLKAAYNYAANRSYYIGRCSAENIDFALHKLGFYTAENGYENDIPSILMGSCKNCGK